MKPVKWPRNISQKCPLIWDDLASFLRYWEKSRTMKKALIFSTLIIFVVVSCKKSDQASNESAGNPTGSVKFNVNKDVILQLVNAARTTGCTCGTTVMAPVTPVTWNDQLGKAAYDHSVDMKANTYFSHTALSGATPGQRITAAGYQWKSFGENIAMGYTTEQAVMAGWLNSEGHCKNIMNGGLKEMGVGREANYWTQVFATK